VAVLYITHRLQELKHIADTVTVLRDGKLVGSLPFDQSDPHTIVKMMFGQIVQKQRPADLAPSAEPLLEVRSLRRAGEFEDISFALGRGEILGIAGMLGSGRTELLRALFGAEPPDGGTIVFDGRTLHPTSPARMRDAVIALVP